MAGSPATPSRAGAKLNAADLGIADALAQLAFVIQATLARRAAAYDLSIIQLRLLGILRDREPGMNDLARFLELDKSSITGLVDRAQRRGLVKRAVSKEDRRAFRVSLTAAGRKLAERVETEFRDDVATIIDGLSDRDQARLSSLASRVVVNQAGGRGAK